MAKELVRTHGRTFSCVHSSRPQLTFEYVITRSVQETLAALDQPQSYFGKEYPAGDTFDLIVADYLLEDGTAFELLTEVTDIPIVIVTGASDVENAVNALKKGAYDYLIKDPDYNYLKILPLIADKAIKRKKTEDLLHLVQYERSVTGSFRSTMSGKLVACNDTFARLLGHHTASDIVDGVHWQEHLEFPHLDFLIDTLQKSENFLTNYPLTLHTRTGKKIYALVNLTLVHEVTTDELLTEQYAETQLGQHSLHHHHTEVIEGTLLDITEYREAEKARLAQEQQFRQLVELAPDGIAIVDAQGIILLANPALAQMVGYTAPNDVLGLPMTQFADSSDCIECLNRVTGQGDVVRREVIFRRKNGQTFPAEVTCGHLNYKGKNAAQIILRDVTERVQARQILEQERESLSHRVAERTAELTTANAALARAAEMKDEFLANMSHELRTPLNAILGLSDALKEEVYGDLNQRQSRSIHMIEESGKLLLALINDILDLSKIEAGRLSFNINPTLVDSVCNASMRLVKQQAFKKDLKLHLDIKPEAKMVDADERRLKQILVNLLTNAVKFTESGGEVGLDVTVDAASEVMNFSVWDTGIGIAEEYLEQLFEPFVQIDSKLSRQYTGAGLGLALVLSMTELHGGSVHVESKVNEGSRFTIVLPWIPPETAEMPTENAELRAIEHRLPVPQNSAYTNGQHTNGPHTHGPHTHGQYATYSTEQKSVPDHGRAPVILLAEDNEANIEMILTYLKLRGYKMVVAKDGAQAIQLTASVKPDLILMDIQMPGTDGLVATRHIRQQDEFKHTPIIALTALAMTGDRERCLEAGATDYASKPITLSHLTALINKHLQTA
ncbi:MAG: response regulator [Chloroflexota bacterium]